MAGPLDKKGAYKSPAWMQKKGKPGVGSQIMAIIIAAIIALIIYY